MSTQLNGKVLFRLGVFAAFLTGAAPCLAASWNLPQDLRDENTKVEFLVDSTWHVVNGSTAGIRGRAWLQTPSDYRSIRAELRFPVGGFNTGNERRDRRLRGS
jgi:hypothetical protein